MLLPVKPPKPSEVKSEVVNVSVEPSPNVSSKSEAAERQRRRYWKIGRQIGASRQILNIKRGSCSDARWIQREYPDTKGIR